MQDEDSVGKELAAAVGSGDREAFEQLFPLYYDDLRRLARAKLRKERPGHTLQPTALVHDVYLRLVKGSSRTPACRDRVHFLVLAGRTMWRILIDHARRHRLSRTRVALPDDLPAPGQAPRDIAVIELDEAIRYLEGLNRRMSEVVQHRIFSGLSIDEIAGLLDVTPRTVLLDWAAARAILRQRLEGKRPGP